MKINIDLVKTGTVVTDVASVFVLVATSNINVYALNEPVTASEPYRGNFGVSRRGMGLDTGLVRPGLG